MFNVKDIRMWQHATAPIGILVPQGFQYNLVVSKVIGPHDQGRKGHDLIAKPEIKVPPPIEPMDVTFVQGSVLCKKELE